MPPADSARRRFATTYHSALRDARFAARARMIPVARQLDELPRGRFRPLDELLLFVRVLWAALHEDVLLLYSSRGKFNAELLAAAVIGLWPRRFRPVVVLYGEMFEPTPGLRHIIERSVMRLADRAIVRYVVFASDVREYFARRWRIDIEKVCVATFYTLQQQPPAPTRGRAIGEHIFAGGNSFRDYLPLVDAARLLPQRQFVICTSRLDGEPDLPPNVQAGVAPLQEFERLLETAAVVVVPLRMHTDRPSGLLTFIESMWKKRPTIVNTATGVRDYVRDGETGWIVDGSPQEYARAIEWVLDPAHAEQVAQVCERAHRAIRDEFTLENHLTRVFEVIEEAVEAAAHARARQ